MVNLDNLFIRLKEKGLNAKKLSEATGISTGNISDWKSGRSMPTAIKLDIIADYLDCSVDYLLGRVDIPNGTYSISNQNTTVTGTQANVINNNNTIEKTDTITEEFMQTFKQLTLADKVAVMEFTMKKINK